VSVQVLADTHAIIWYLFDAERLSSEGRAALDGAIDAGFRSLSPPSPSSRSSTSRRSARSAPARRSASARRARQKTRASRSSPSMRVSPTASTTSYALRFPTCRTASSPPRPSLLACRSLPATTRSAPPASTQFELESFHGRRSKGAAAQPGDGSDQGPRERLCYTQGVGCAALGGSSPSVGRAATENNVDASRDLSCPRFYGSAVDL
jgi:hypothetical protein